jgi:hypothetical protein
MGHAQGKINEEMCNGMMDQTRENLHRLSKKKEEVIDFKKFHPSQESRKDSLFSLSSSQIEF